MLRAHSDALVLVHVVFPPRAIGESAFHEMRTIRRGALLAAFEQPKNTTEWEASNARTILERETRPAVWARDWLGPG
jgi:hypothetical protein